MEVESESINFYYMPNLILIRNANIVVSCSTQLKVIKVRRMCFFFISQRPARSYLGVASDFYPAFFLAGSLGGVGNF